MHYICINRIIISIITIAFQPLPDNPPEHFATMIAKRWRLVRMNEECMRPNLEIIIADILCMDTR